MEILRRDFNHFGVSSIFWHSQNAIILALGFIARPPVKPRLNDHFSSDQRLVNPGADGGDHARPVAAQNGRQLYIRIETLPYEDVTVIERGGFQSDYGFA